MALTFVSSTRTIPRLDLSKDELLHLSIFVIYLSPDLKIVTSVLNNFFKPRPRLALDQVEVTYLHLHDTQHPVWTRARDMNRTEKALLKGILSDHGVERELLGVDIITPVAMLACMRPCRVCDESEEVAEG